MNKIPDKQHLLQNRTINKRLDHNRVRRMIATILTIDQKQVDVLRRKSRKIRTKGQKRDHLLQKKDTVPRLRIGQNHPREEILVVPEETPVEARKHPHRKDQDLGHIPDHEDRDHPHIRDQKGHFLEKDLEDQRVHRGVGIQEDHLRVHVQIEDGEEDRGQKVAAGVRDLTGIEQLLDPKRLYILYQFLILVHSKYADNIIFDAITDWFKDLSWFLFFSIITLI